MVKMKLKIFKKGKITDNAGNEYEYNANDLKLIAHSYDPSIHAAPLKIGHSVTDDGPNHGRVESLEYNQKDGFLYAVFSNLTPQAFDWINSKRADFSASFYNKDHPNNPVKGIQYLHHVAFVDIGAVKGLTDDVVMAFSEFNLESTPDIIEDQDMDNENKKMLDELENKLKQKEAELAEKTKQLEEKEREYQHNQNVNYAESIANKLPGNQNLIIDFMDTMSKDQIDKFKSIIDSMTPQVDFKEYSAPSKEQMSEQENLIKFMIGRGK